MRLSRRQLLLNSAAASTLVAVRAPAQSQEVEVLPPVPSLGDKVVWPAKMPSSLDRAIERGADVAEAGGSFLSGYRMLVNASTNQRLNVPFQLSVAVLRLGRRDRCRHPISFRIADSAAELPSPYEFSSKDDLYECHLFNVALKSEGKHVVYVRDEQSGTEFPSNVIVASREEPKYKLYFGDIHIHTQWSYDAVAEPDYSYIYARDAMNLDFACLTEHNPTDYIWEKIKAKARELYQPGRFATLSAYEWSAAELNEGHKNVYYRDWEGPILRSTEFPERANTRSAADLWAKLRKAGKSGADTLTIPHHMAAKHAPTPWDHYDPDFQRCAEVYSTWGNSESPAGPRQIRINGGFMAGHFVQDGLAAGQRLGFVGASDSHSGRPGYPAHSEDYYNSDYASWDPNQYTGGFTGVYAEELTREAIFDAVRNRRSYATTGKRIILDFKVDGHWMGEEYKSRDAPHLTVKVGGTAPVATVTVVKNNQDYLRVEGRGRHEVEFEYGNTEPPRTTDWYYVRVIQEDYEMAWASPVWVSRP